MLLPVASKSLFLCLILESLLIWFSQVQYGFGGGAVVFHSACVSQLS